MNKYEIIKNIEQFAPKESAEPWDCVGFEVETSKIDVSKIMLCLTVTDNIIQQAKSQNCDMIISHHPLFFVPLEWADIDIYSAHTNLDKAKGGTTDTMIKVLGFESDNKLEHEYLRFVTFDNSILLDDFIQKLKEISPNLRYVNNKSVSEIKRIAFCAGSGSEFIKDAQQFGADCFVTGDLKFHTALDSNIVVVDVGHFESEILVLPVLKDLIGNNVEVVFADEKSPFNY
ncbi:Nif3-like dinuclear metal center hexameric protein [bacterium]|nr:Nif3-like dinuclear metal center hexameric protein [bacterium]